MENRQEASQFEIDNRLNFHPDQRIDLYTSDSPDREVTKSMEEEGMRLLVPRFHLYGIKERREYTAKKIKPLEEEFNKYADPRQLIEESPVQVCALLDERSDQMRLVVFNGHHRTRLSGKMGITHIPTNVYTVEQATTIVNSDQHWNNMFNEELTPSILSDYLNTWMLEAIHSFSRVMPDYKMPIPVPNARSLEDLQARFSGF